MKYGYVTLLSSATYLPGVIALARSLRETGTKIFFECVCSKNINAEVIDTLHYHKIKTHQLEYSVVDNLPISNSPEYSHWNYTFDKLFLWDMKEYDKIVFLDSDMLILSNIDYLFEYPDFSACRAGFFLNSTWTRLNSGLMVIVPNTETYEGLKKQLSNTILKYTKEGKNVGDQDVINDFMPDWPNHSELHLPEGLNMFFKYLSLAKETGFSFGATEKEKRISVVHFIGAVKPWNLKGIKKWIYLLKVLINNRYGLKICFKYLNFIKL